MENTKDLIIGFITDYTDYNKIKPYVNSLNRCGFAGDKVMVVYNIGFDIVEKLKEEGFMVIGFEVDMQNQKYTYKQPFNIVVNRFFDMWMYLKSIKTNYRYVISTDVADVVFQLNPSVYLENIMDDWNDKQLIVGCENLLYNDEDWGIHNMYQSFGDVAARYMQYKPIYNAGTIAGRMDTFADFCYNIYLLCRGAPMHVLGGGGPDQAAMNLLLTLEPYKSITHFDNHDQWACQCGTVVDPTKIDKFRPKFINSNGPVITDDGIVVNLINNVAYYMVHQYNRVPDWNEKIRKRYE